MLGVVDEVLVDLVADAHQVVFYAGGGDQIEFGAAQHAAGGIVWGVEQQYARSRGDRCVQRIWVEREVGRAQRDRPSLRSGEGDAGRVRVVVRLEHHNLVARIAQPQERGRDRLGRAKRDQQILRLEPVVVALVLEHRFAQRRDAGEWGVLVVAVAQGRYRRLDRAGRAVGVRKALSEVDRAGANRKRAHLGEDRGPESLRPRGRPHAGSAAPQIPGPRRCS